MPAPLVRAAWVHTAAVRWHELREASSEEVARSLVKRAGQGDPVAASQLGLPVSITAAEAEAALARAAADLELLALELRGDPDLDEPRGPLRRLPFAAAEALRRLAWQEAWRGAQDRAARGERPILRDGGAAGGLPPPELLRPGVRQRLAQKAKAQWLQEAAKPERDGGASLLPPGVADGIARLAAAHARHCATFRVRPRSVELATAEWEACVKELRRIKAEHALHEKLVDIVEGVCRNASWHAANLTKQSQGAGGDEHGEEEEGEDEDDEEGCEELFGKEHHGGQCDPLADLMHFLRHSWELHHGDDEYRADPWRGLIVAADASDQDVRRAASAGFNCVRVRIPRPPPSAAVAHLISLGGGDRPCGAGALLADVLAPVRRLLSVCQAAGLGAVLDITAWPVPRFLGQEGGALDLVQDLAAAVASQGCVNGVALPNTPRLPTALAMASALREGGLAAARCAAIVSLEGDLLDEIGDCAGELREALSEGERGLLLSDGNVVLEVAREEFDRTGAPTPVHVLDHASLGPGSPGPWHADIQGYGDLLPLGCLRFNLQPPAKLAEACELLGERWREELAMRHSASSSSLTHGWFVSLEGTQGSLNACLSRRWRWPDPEASRVLWPHCGPHVCTLVVMDGFQSGVDSWVTHPEYFQLELPAETDDAEDDAEDDESEINVRYEAYPGLKVIIPQLPLLEHPAYEGWRGRGWYSYVTDHEGEAEDELVTATLDATTRRIHAILDEESELLGDSRRVLLAGSSMGCCAALHVGLSYPHALGGLCASQGHLLSCTQVPPDWAARGTPLRVFNGLEDQTMPWAKWVSKSYERLRRAGGDVQFTVEEDVEHCDEEAEARWFRSFLLECYKA